MTAPRYHLLLPTVARHLAREFLQTFALTLAAFVAIVVIAEFFDRFEAFLHSGVGILTIAEAFLYRVPFVISQVTPFAVLASALVGLGLLARHNEFVALRSCGVSLWQITAPLAVLAALIGVATFFWGETAVPASAKRWNQIWNQEVKKRTAAGIFAGREVWYHGKVGLYNINRVAPRRRTLYGLTVYQLRRDDFRPVRVIQVPTATWTDSGWRFESPRTQRIDADGVREEAGLPPGFTLPETLEDFKVVAIEPEEASYAMLRRQIKGLIAKGVDVSESWVDLRLKVALPAASLVMMLLAVPLVARGTRATSLPAAAGLGITIGFGYFVVLGLTRALGQAGSLPPLLAAWTANGVFALVAGYYLLAAD